MFLVGSLLPQRVFSRSAALSFAGWWVCRAQKSGKKIIICNASHISLLLITLSLPVSSSWASRKAKSINLLILIIILISINTSTKFSREAGGQTLVLRVDLRDRPLGVIVSRQRWWLWWGRRSFGEWWLFNLLRFLVEEGRAGGEESSVSRCLPLCKCKWH